MKKTTIKTDNYIFNIFLNSIFMLFILTVLLCGCTKESVETEADLPSASEELAQKQLLSKDKEHPFEYRLNTFMPRDRNYVFSPLSIKMSLDLAANGADGITKEEIIDTIAVEDIEKFNSYEKQLISTYVNNGDIQIKLANSLWLNTDRAKKLNFSDLYLRTIGRMNNAKLGNVTNKDAVDTINVWCSQNTNGKITEIIDNNEFSAALVNALYFSGKWTKPFSGGTQVRTFNERGGNSADITFMSNTDEYNYYEDSEVKMIELPYGLTKEVKDANKDDKNAPDSVDIAMYVVLNGDRRMELSPYMDILSPEKVNVTLPVFTVAYGAEYNEPLKQLGVNTAFDSKNADFHYMTGVDKPKLSIDKVAHEAYITVDENGTEAAPAEKTAYSSEEPDDQPEEIKEFTANEPFTFIIVDKRMNEVLFMGEYAYAE